MIGNNKGEKHITACMKELKYIQKQEKAFEEDAAEGSAWKTSIEKKIPRKVSQNIEKAFMKGFGIVFDKGSFVIEKSYNKEGILEDYAVKNFSVQIKKNRKELKRMRKSAKRSDVKNVLATTAEGIGLGILGIGLPDIVLFTGFILKGIYETALHYGIDYEQPFEKYIILRMMEGSLAKGSKWTDISNEINRLFENIPERDWEEAAKEQLEKTAKAFAMDMLVLKFIQGLPVAGIIGGMSNPIYYKKILDYVSLKYYRRYIVGELKNQHSEEVLV